MGCIYFKMICGEPGGIVRTWVDVKSHALFIYGGLSRGEIYVCTPPIRPNSYALVGDEGGWRWSCEEWYSSTFAMFLRDDATRSVPSTRPVR